MPTSEKKDSNVDGRGEGRGAPGSRASALRPRGGLCPRGGLLTMVGVAVVGGGTTADGPTSPKNDNALAIR